MFADIGVDDLDNYRAYYSSHPQDVINICYFFKEAPHHTVIDYINNQIVSCIGVKDYVIEPYCGDKGSYIEIKSDMFYKLECKLKSKICNFIKNMTPLTDDKQLWNYVIEFINKNIRY